MKSSLIKSKLIKSKLIKSVPVNYKFIGRQLVYQKRQSAIFILCVILAIVSLTTLDGFQVSVNQSIFADRQALIGADIIIKSRHKFSSPLVDQINQFKKRQWIGVSKFHLFYTMVQAEGPPINQSVNTKSRQTKKNNQSLLVGIKAVDPNYPLYGEVELQSGLEFRTRLTPRHIIVEQSLLDRMGLIIGDEIFIGAKPFEIIDVVIQEPDRPLEFFGLGPRVLMTISDLESLNLIQNGSRVRHRILLKVKDAQQHTNFIYNRLQASAMPRQERVQTIESAQNRMQRFFDNLIFFLSAIGIFTLLLAGIGMQSTLTALLNTQKKTIAVVKTVGGTKKFLFVHYGLFVLCLSMIGLCLGLLLAYFFQWVLIGLFSEFFFESISLHISLKGILQAIFSSLFIVSLFTLLPLLRLVDVKPVAIFRIENESSVKKQSFIIIVTAILIFLGVIFTYYLRDVRSGLYFLGSFLGLMAVAALISGGCVKILKQINRGPLILKQAIKGLNRPGNSTLSIIITFASAAGFIFSIVLIEQNLDRTFIQAFPKDAPNLYFMDIQPHQKQKFEIDLGLKTEYHGIVRGRVIKINGVPVDQSHKRKRANDNILREFSFTERKYLLPNQKIIAGHSLKNENVTGPQVSVLKYMADNANLKLGDQVTFRILGIPITATVTSIRKRMEKPAQPFFVFVFPDDTLKNAPKVYFTGVRVPENDISAIQNKMVAQFPNVSAINLNQTLKTASRTTRKLSVVVQMFALLSLAAGLLLLVGSILATRTARIQEAAFYKILGAKSNFIFWVFVYENVIMGSIAGLTALVLSQVSGYLIIAQQMKLEFNPLWGISFGLFIGIIILVVLVGSFLTINITRQKPVKFLRLQEF